MLNLYQWKNNQKIYENLIAYAIYLPSILMYKFEQFYVNFRIQEKGQKKSYRQLKTTFVNVTSEHPL